MTKCRYDLIAVDLDGTLLDRSGAVSARNAAALRLAADAGIEIVIATGRSLAESDHVLQSIDHSGRFIGVGGAMLHDLENNSVLDRSVMDGSLVTRLSNRLLEHNHLVHLLKDREQAGYDYLILGDGTLDPASQWWFRTFPVEVKFASDGQEDEHPDATIRCGTVAASDELAPIAEEIRDDFGDAIFLQHWAAVTETHATGSPTHLLEIFNPDVDKWTALARYAEQSNVDVQRIAAIGDGLNDVRMIRQAQLGIAVANAEAGVLHVADRVVASNEEDGVAVAIEALVRGQF